MVNNKYKKQKQVQDKLTSNSLEDAIKKIKELSALKKRKFVESVDIAVNLGIDPKQSDQSVKGSILLPNGSGKKIKVIVFTETKICKKSPMILVLLCLGSMT